MGAVPVQEANRLWSANRATSPTSARIRAAGGRADPVDVHQPGAGGGDCLGQPPLERLELAVQHFQLGQEFGGQRPPGPPGQIPRPDTRQQCLRLQRRQVPGCTAGTSSASSRCSRFSVRFRAWDTSSRRSASSRDTTRSSSSASCRSPRVRSATMAIEWASVASVLRPCPVSNTRTRAASFAGTSHTVSPSASSRAANGRPTPLAPSTPTPAPATAAHSAAVASSRSCPSRTALWPAGSPARHVPRSSPTACADRYR
jgi:hypothetical protein